MTNLDIFLIDYEICNVNTNWWLEIADIFLKPGLRVKASFDKYQDNILENLSAYGKDLEIRDGKSLIELEGILSNEMINDFKASYKVKKGGGIDCYSPFISLEIGDNCCSAHNRRELYLTGLSEVELGDVLNVLNPLREYFKIDIS